MIRGGLRTRLVTDSTRLAVLAGLEGLGWFDPTIYDNPPGLRRHRPLYYVPMPVMWHTVVEANAIAISIDDVTDEEHGLGGEVEDQILCYIDVFAENDQIGWELALNVRDILLGKIPSLGRTGPTIDVYDLRMATPVPVGQVDVVDAMVDQAQSEARAWQDHWFMIRCHLEDDYGDEYGVNYPTTDWSSQLQPAWDWIQAAGP